MKKIYSLLVVLSLLANAVFAQTPTCTVDPQAQPNAGISPGPGQLPCIVVGEEYNQTIQVQNLSNFNIVVTVDSMILNSVTGLPAGINWSKNPNVLYSGQNGCLTFYGTTNAAPGKYTLGWQGTVWFSAPYIGNQSYSGDLSQFAGQYKYYLNVINPGDSCRPVSSVNDFSADLNSAMYVFPNPSNGAFEVSLNAGKRVNGEILIFDMTGRKVFSQELDAIGSYSTSIDITRFAKGLYTLQLKTADGFASRRISVE